MKNDDCIFCKIITGEVPSEKIYEDDNVFSFLDHNPVNPGHALVIPKDHHSNIYDIPEDTLCDVISVTKKLSVAIKKAVEADGINLVNNNDPGAGQVVFHYHMHIIPRFEEDGLKHWGGKGEYDTDKAREIMEKIKNNL